MNTILIHAFLGTLLTDILFAIALRYALRFFLSKSLSWSWVWYILLSLFCFNYMVMHVKMALHPTSGTRLFPAFVEERWTR